MKALNKHPKKVFMWHKVNELKSKGFIESPKQWAEVLEDEVLATALLDSILYHCEVIKIEGNSYILENRKEIFKK